MAGMLCQPVSANDAVAHLATGGLELGTTDAIEMRSEDLYVSPSLIRVKYRFFNRTEKDVTTLVAFPLPELTGIKDGDFALPTQGAHDNFLDFRTQVDGQPVATQIEQRAFAQAREQTQTLQAHGIPLAPHLNSTYDTLERLPDEVRHELLHLGLVSREQEDRGQGLRHYYYPEWSLQTKYYWQQTFPAKAETLIEHEYRPSVGEMVDTGIDRFGRADLMGDLARRYCIDGTFVDAAKRARRRLPEGGYLREKTIEYILKTGAGWAGPIRNFRLVVDKGRTDRLVSFCARGVKKISATQFEVRKADFTPQGNLDILFLVPSSEAGD
jgi:hypothetical protein